MKFNTTNAPAIPDDSVAIGNVYLSKNSRVTKYWVVVGLRDRTVIMLGLDEEGNISSSASYGQHCFEDAAWCKGRKPIGRVVNMPTLEFQIEWDSLP